MSRFAPVALIVALCMFTVWPVTAQQSPAPDFVPDYIFSGSQLTGWTPVGQVDWQAQNGAITGTARAGNAGGWLMSEQGFEDVAVFARFRCTGACDAGVLLRAEKTSDGMKGLFVSLTEEEVAPYRVMIDNNGRFTAREIAYEGQFMNFGDNTPHVESEAWNTIEIFLRANQIENHLNGAWSGIRGGFAHPHEPDTQGGGFAPRETMKQGFGPIALYVGSGKVQFEDIAVKDLINYAIEPEQISSRFSMQRVADFYYAWGTDVADLDRDGVNDLIAGPYYYLGPDFRNRREYFPSRTRNPGVEFTPHMLVFAQDWTRDGWADIIVSEMRPLTLFVNPKGESRRWDRVVVLPDVCSEIAIRADVDSDGQVEIVYVDKDSRVAYGEPDPENPVGPWLDRKISEPVFEFNGCSIHGVGAGDINGDGRIDILQTTGWWEQPATDPAHAAWTYHEALFGQAPTFIGGGGQISVYDFNGDGLNDVVSSLSAHGWGLAWFEQKRDATGNITFVKHIIMEDFSTKNAGDVTFSEPHAGAVLADIDRDGVMDFVVGKRHWAHLDTIMDPDADGEAVIYWYRTVRKPDAPGGVEFVPELIHNKSGVGSEVKALDVNNDGAIDIITSSTRGSFVFWGVPE